MTMTMTSSLFGLDDMEALLCGPSSPMADVMDALLINSDKVGKQKAGRAPPEAEASPLSPIVAPSSLSSSSSPPPFYSPPASPPALLFCENKAETESDLLSFPWLADPMQLRGQTSSDESNDDEFSDLDWMAERVDLSEFDLDSLIDSCSPAEEAPSSPEEFLASLDSPMELDSFRLPSFSTSANSVPPYVPPSVSSDTITVNDPESHIDGQKVPSSPLCVPEPQEELEIKSEPASPDPSPIVADSPCSPEFTLDLGSEVDISESEMKPAVAPVVPRIVLSLSPTRIVLVLAPKNQVGTPSEVVHQSPPASPPQRSARSRPYPEPQSRASSPSHSVVLEDETAVRSSSGGRRKTLKAPRDKKQKKMEQNKTAATRYRQKKRAEQDALLKEYAQLERKNIELTEKAESMGREIEYLKELMEEVRQTRMKKGLHANP